MNDLSKTVLLCEDEAPLLKILASEFRDAGFTVLEATNGQEALDHLATAHPNIILLDLIMPKMDGFAFLAEFKKKPEASQIPVIVLTNLSDADTTATLLKEGMYDYLIKTDWHPSDVVAKVKTKLGI